MNVLEKRAADFQSRTLARERGICSDQCVQHAALERGQSRETFTKPVLETLQDQRHHGHVSDLVSRKSFTNKFGPQRSQMNYGAAAGEGHDEAAHEINRMIRGNDAQVVRAGPEREDRRDGHALFEIILVRENATLRAARGPGRIDDACRIFACARDKHGLDSWRESPPNASLRRDQRSAALR